MFSASHPAGGHSHLYVSLRSYLHNQSRAQPIIGLSSITEVQTYAQPAVYFCDVCDLRITKDDIRNHIMGSIHKYNYIKSHHAHGWGSYSDLTLLARPLMNIANQIEKREGTGDIQFLHVDEVLFKEITSLPVPDAFAQIKTLKNQQDPDAFHLHVNNSLSEGNKDRQQETGRAHGTAHLPTSGRFLSSQCVSTTPSRSKCSVKFEPQTFSTSPSPDASLPRSAGPVEPLSQWQDVSSRVPFPESSPAPALSRHVNQYRPVIPGRNQRRITPSENQCLTEARTISVMRPPGQWSPVTLPSQSDEDSYEVIQSFGVSYETHLLRLDQTTPYETQSLSANHMASEITQDLSNRFVHFRNESSSVSPEPVRDEEMTKSIRTRVLTGAQEPRYDPSHYEASSQDPIHTGCETHEFQSDSFAEENRFLSSQNPVEQMSSFTPTRCPSGRFQSVEDVLENYDGPKPLIGLQAVIKCQSVDGNPSPCFYLCQLCSVKLKKKNKIFSHLTNPEHQRNYIKVLHPRLLLKKRKSYVTCEMLEDFAIHLEKQDGRGHIKVMRLSACLFSEMLNRNYPHCMNVLNCGAGVGWRSDLLPFKEGKTTGPSQTAKRPAESTLLPPYEKWLVKASAEAPTQQMSKKMKTANPNKVTCANRVQTVFKVSLSLQEGPVVIERAPLRDTTTVAPEIEGQTPASTRTDNSATVSLTSNTGSEVYMSVHGCPQAEYATPQRPDGDELAQTGVPTLNRTHSEMIPHADGHLYEDPFMGPAQYAYSGQLNPLRPGPWGSEGEAATVTRADWPVQDWSFQTNQWQSGDHPQCAGYMQY